MSVMSVCIIWFLAISNRNICSAFQTTRSNRCDKRKERKIRVGNKRKLVALIFMCSVFHSRAMEQQQAMLERVAALAEAATRAAIAAERVAGQTSASSSTSGDGLSHASKLLKSPESFSGEDALNFPSWRFQFTSCLTYGESKYVAMLKKIEALTTSPDIATYSPEERVLAHRLYAVLTSYLKGRCGHLCKSMAQSRDGFAVRYHLIKEFEPSSRQRALAIAQALSNYPTVPKGELPRIDTRLRGDRPEV